MKSCVLDRAETPIDTVQLAIGIALVQIFFCDNPQGMHVALAKNLTPYCVVPCVTCLIAGPKRAALSNTTMGGAAFAGVIGQFEVMMIAMLFVNPFVLFVRKPRPIN
jgi:DHA2 family multidrug resistance protein